MRILLKFNEVEKLIEVEESFINKNNLLDNMQFVAEEENCEDNPQYIKQFEKNEKEFIGMIIDLVEKHFNTEVNRQNFFYLSYLPRERDIAKEIKLRIKAKDFYGFMDIGYSHSEMLELVNKIKQNIKNHFKNGD
jgi:hypothetical protein